MKPFNLVFILLILTCSAFHLNAQELRDNELVVIQGEKFVMHQVRTGETIFSITRKYKIDRKTLTKYNPGISEGLDIGQILKIPYKEEVDFDQLPIYKKGDPTRFEIYKIRSRKETPYFIAKKFGVKVEEIFTYNPGKRRFKKGAEIRIPIWEQVEAPKSSEPKRETVSNESDTPVGALKTHTVVSGETLFSISKKYQVSESEILFLNPEARNLKAGAKLVLPPNARSSNNVIDEPKTVSTATGNYFEHIIESGETMWGTTRKYNVSESELKELNPVLRTAFPAGVVIKIPVKSKPEETQAKPVNDEAFIKHLVTPGETLYGLAAKYDLKIHEIRKYNPVLERRNLVIGETVLIPDEMRDMEVLAESNNIRDSIRQVEAFYEVELPIEIPESCRLPEFDFNSGEHYEIALFLPLYLEANDTLNRDYEMLELADSLAAIEIELLEEDLEIVLDTTIEQEEPRELFKRFYGSSENFLQFYEGVLLAIDTMQTAGMNISLKVYDTQQDIDSLRKDIYDEQFLNTDLIIGPVLQNIKTEVASIAAKNRIPMVAPLVSNSSITRSNPHYYQVIPSREYVGEKTAEMVAEEYFNSNFIIVKMSEYEGTSEGELVELIREKLFNSGFLSSKNGVSFTVYDLKNEGPWGLRRIMSKRKENVVYIPSIDEGELSVAISNVNNLADDYSITLIGSNRYLRNESINIEQYHNLKMRYIAPYWMDYTKESTIRFVEKFKENFGTEPINYGAQGYDVTFYFLSALKYYGRDFQDCLPYLQVDLVQGNYHFEKISQFGGFMNEGVSVISYSRDYEVSRKRTKGQPKLIAEY